MRFPVMFESQEGVDLPHMQALKPGEVWHVFNKNAITAWWAVPPCRDRVNPFTKHALETRLITRGEVRGGSRGVDVDVAIELRICVNIHVFGIGIGVGLVVMIEES
jgi:hypothetical protein